MPMTTKKKEAQEKNCEWNKNDAVEDYIRWYGYSVRLIYFRIPMHFVEETKWNFCSAIKWKQIFFAALSSVIFLNSLVSFSFRMYS